MKYSVEIVHKIWNDDGGEHVSVGPDRDGLGMVEIIDVASGGEMGPSLSFPPELARLIAQAMIKCVDELSANAPEVTKSV